MVLWSLGYKKQKRLIDVAWWTNEVRCVNHISDLNRITMSKRPSCACNIPIAHNYITHFVTYSKQFSYNNMKIDIAWIQSTHVFVLQHKRILQFKPISYCYCALVSNKLLVLEYCNVLQCRLIGSKPCWWTTSVSQRIFHRL